MNTLYVGFVKILLDVKPVINLARVVLVEIKLRCVLSKLLGHGLWRFNIKKAEGTR
jgi:hypothetical protein